ncbi:MAG: rhomboid family intramembrane serine protease [Candidatus Micrarchaeota archaeon]
MNLSIKLLGIIIVLFIVQMLVPTFTNLFIFIPLIAFSEPWRFFTSMFLHGDVMHILFNGFALFMFGSLLERKVSTKDFLIIFVGAGLLGGILYYLTTFTMFNPICQSPFGGVWSCPALGASGAVFGILGALALLLPEVVVYMWFFPMKMRYAPIVWFILGVFMQGGNVAHAAHLGGLIFGLIYGWYLSRHQPDTQSGFYQPNWQQQ